MRKSLITATSLVLILLAILLITPFFVGLWIQKHNNSILQSLARQHNVSVKLLRYHRGWFSSEATTEVTLKSHWLIGEHLSQANPSFIVKQHILHGPVIITENLQGNSKLYFAKGIIKDVINTEQLKAHAMSVWQFNNELTNTYASNKFNIGYHLTTISADGIKGLLTFNLKRLATHSNLMIKNGKIIVHEIKKPNTPLLTIDFASLHTNSHFQFNKQFGVWSGKRSITFTTSVFTSMTAATTVSGFQSEFRLQPKKHTTNIKFKFAIASMINQHLQLHHINFDLRFNDLNTQMLKQFYEKNKQLKAKGIANNPALILPTLIELINKGFNIELKNFNLSSPDGKLSLTANLMIPKQSGTPSLSYAYTHSTLEGELAIPQSLLEKLVEQFFHNKIQRILKLPPKVHTPKQLAQFIIQFWIENGMLVPHNKILLMKFQFHNGKLLINGRRPSDPQVSLGVSAPYKKELQHESSAHAVPTTLLYKARKAHGKGLRKSH